jgi:hypothetical protein
MSEDDAIATARGFIPVNEAAALAGITAKKRVEMFRRKLQAIHEEHGGALFRFSTARNAPLWTTLQVLRREFPGVFGEPPETSGLDVLDLRRMVLDLTKRVEALESRKRAG